MAMPIARLLPLVFVALGACVGGGQRLPPPRHARATPLPPRFAPARPPGTSSALKACVGNLDRIVARYALLPDRQFGGGCSATGAVQLRDIGTPTANLGAMTCPLAYAFTRWVQDDVARASRTILNDPVVRIETMGSYACRNVNGAASGRLSEHAFANAVDVGAFVTASGRRISVRDDWARDDDAAAFLRAIREKACARFATVLSPDYNAAHHDHLHLDMAVRPLCR